MNRVPHPSNGKKSLLTTRFRYVLPMVRDGVWLQESCRGQDATISPLDTSAHPRAGGPENVQRVRCTTGRETFAAKKQQVGTKSLKICKLGLFDLSLLTKPLVIM